MDRTFSIGQRGYLSDSRLKSPEKLFESRHGGEQNDYLVFPSKAGTIKSIAGR